MEAEYTVYCVSGPKGTCSYGVEEYFTSRFTADRFAYSVNVLGGWVEVEAIKVDKKKHDDICRNS